MAKLTSFSLLSFDVYGTLIDWEGGILEALKPLLAQNPSKTYTRQDLIPIFHELETAQQTATPAMPYNKVLAAVHKQLASKLGLSTPSQEDSAAFGNSVGDWPAFPDTVDALQRLSKTYKLLVLSNVDRASFQKCNAGPLAGVTFDGVLTAQDIGSYKPDTRNFEYMLRYVKEQFGIDKDQVLQTAQSQFHDHQPAKKLGIRSAWIARQKAAMGDREGAVFDWKFATLGEMADAVESEKGE